MGFPMESLGWGLLVFGVDQRHGDQDRRARLRRWRGVLARIASDSVDRTPQNVPLFSL